MWWLAVDSFMTQARDSVPTRRPTAISCTIATNTFSAIAFLVVRSDAWCWLGRAGRGRGGGEVRDVWTIIATGSTEGGGLTGGWWPGLYGWASMAGTGQVKRGIRGRGRGIQSICHAHGKNAEKKGAPPLELIACCISLGLW